MRGRQYLVTDQSELLPRGELPGAGVASEAGQVEDLVVSSPDPVRLCDGVTTLGALGAVQPEKEQLQETEPRLADLTSCSPPCRGPGRTSGSRRSGS